MGHMNPFHLEIAGLRQEVRRLQQENVKLAHALSEEMKKTRFAIGTLVLSAGGEIVVSMDTIQSAGDVQVKVRERPLKREVVYTASLLVQDSK